MQGKCIFTIVLSLILSVNICQAQAPKKNLKIYMAAALFNGRENVFNLVMTRQMENLGYQTILPLRDGFESGDFNRVAKKFMPIAEIPKAQRDLIYLRDIGIFIPESDVVLANLDEPLDEGVIVEITYAHMMGKPVIGYRTDTRTPYNSEEGVSGMHSFPAFQCDYFITQHLPGSDSKSFDEGIKSLAVKIDGIINNLKLSATHSLPDYVMANPKISDIIASAHDLVGDPAAMKTEAGIQATVKRLTAQKVKKEFFVTI